MRARWSVMRRISLKTPRRAASRSSAKSERPSACPGGGGIPSCPRIVGNRSTVLTTRSGAMPETTAGFGHMIEPHEDEPRLAKEFAQMTIDALAAARGDPDRAEAQRAQQIEFARTNYSWQARVIEWESYLADIVRQGF